MQSESNITRTELIEFLNQELNRLEEAETHRGFSHWAILAALATILWTIIPLLHQDNLLAIAGSVYFLQSLVMTWIALARAVSYSDEDTNNSNRLLGKHLAHWFSSDAPFVFLYFCSFFVGGIYLLHGMGWWFWLAHVILWGIPIVFVLSTMLFSKSGVMSAVPLSMRKEIVYLGRTVFLTGTFVGCVVAASCLQAYSRTNQSYGVGVLQAALLISASIFLLSKLIDASTNKNIRQVVHDVLVQLSLGIVSEHDAKRTAEMLFVGADVNSVLAIDIGEFISILDAGEKLLNDVTAKLDESKEKNPETRRAEINSLLKEVEMKYEAVNKIKNKIDLKMQIMNMTTGKRNPEADLLLLDLIGRQVNFINGVLNFKVNAAKLNT